MAIMPSSCDCVSIQSKVLYNYYVLHNYIQNMTCSIGGGVGWGGVGGGGGGIPETDISVLMWNSSIVI